MECFAWFVAILVPIVFLLLGLWPLALAWVGFLILLAILDAAK